MYWQNSTGLRLPIEVSCKFSVFFSSLQKNVSIIPFIVIIYTVCYRCHGQKLDWNFVLASGPLWVYCQSNTVSEQVKVELLFVILCVKACPHNQAWSGITHSHHLVHRKQAACVCPCVPMIHRIPPHAENHCKNLCISLSEMPVLSKTSPQVAVCLSKMAIRPSELFLCSFFTCCFPVLLSSCTVRKPTRFSDY